MPRCLFLPVTPHPRTFPPSSAGLLKPKPSSASASTPQHLRTEPASSLTSTFPSRKPRGASASRPGSFTSTPIGSPSSVESAAGSCVPRAQFRIGRSDSDRRILTHDEGRRPRLSARSPMVDRLLRHAGARGTVNRELEGLRQALTLAARRTPPLLAKVPYIPLLKVENARQGFLSRADFEALLAQMTDADVRDFLEWFWWTGMRPGEI